MLNIKESKSDNFVKIVGILKELDVEQRTTNDGRDYVSAKATIRVDQDINGKYTENEIPVRFFAMKKKSDGTQNKLYDNISKFKDNYVSLASCPEDNPEMASKVAISSGRIEENMWLDSSREVRSNFAISSNFMNLARDNEQEARFELSGVVMNMAREVDMNGDETGRLKIKFAVVQYGGRVDVIDLIAASDNAVNYIEQNWEKGDTVTLTGAVCMSQKIEEIREEQGFGEPIIRQRTINKRELIILGGSSAGLEENFAYDANDIKTGLAERQVRAEKLKEKASSQHKNNKPKNDFDDF